MSYSEDPSHNATTDNASLPPSSSIVDFSKYQTGLHPAHSRYLSDQRPHSSKFSDDSDSDNSQALYMKESKRPKRINRALSSIGNGSDHVVNGSLGLKSQLDEDTTEEASWNIIDREIFEWQYVCQTGRPYWWSPESKYTRLKKLQPRLVTEPNPKIWMRGVIDERTRPTYDCQRRAVSDNYLLDPSKTDDLAQMIAIQLLGSCFTLPPDHITGAPSPNYSIFDKGGATLPDPRMISSLRMHTHFRYSPCFGHQARNTSPVQSWPGVLNGTSPTSSPAPDEELPPAALKTRPFLRKRGRGSGSSNGHFGEKGSFHDEIGEQSTTTRTGGRRPTLTRHQSTPDKRRLISPQDLRRQNSESHRVGKRPFRQRPPIVPNPSLADESPHMYRDSQSSQSPRTNYRLQPIIRSEPHPVYVQPVKELVVKRWKTFRRRFGGSLHGPLTSEDQSLSESGQSGESNPIMSTDAIGRRRLARERGEIHSSADITPHFNTPVSGNLSPNRSNPNTPIRVDSNKSTPQFELADPLRAAAALVEAQYQTSGGPPTPQTPFNTPLSKQSTSSGLPSPINIPSPRKSNANMQEHRNILLAPANTPSLSCSSLPASIDSAMSTSGNVPKSESAYFNPLKQPAPSSAHSFASKRQTRQRRKSMLSEVCTPEDLRCDIAEGDNEIVDRSILSAIGSTLASPREETDLISPLRLPGQWLDTVSSSPQSTKGTLRLERPRFSRTSTSGSQIFTPSLDGVELDGLPVGPSKDMWEQVGNGSRREPSYL